MDKAVFKSNLNHPEELLSEFFSAFDYFSEEERNNISKAWFYLLDLCKNDSEVYVHALRVAYILAQNKLDSDTIIAAICHAAVSLGVLPEELEKDIGENAARIVLGASKISFFSKASNTSHQADSIRKMMFALSDDVRIILLKLADRLDKMRNLRTMETENQKAVAEEVIEIWAPLADRLGMQAEKNELEDLSLKYTNPDVFHQIKDIVSQKQEERAQYLKSAVERIKERAWKQNIEVTISSRAKHFYSIYQKMRKRNVEAGELFDLLALRIICNTTTECYTLIGIVHEMWTPLDGRFKDYIAVPKANGYQSLHTTVMCQGRPLEIQVRTKEMHNMAEHGVASHWLYKKGTNKDNVTESQLGIFNQLQELKKNNFSNDSFYTELKNELLKDEIYVFTPKGDVVHLPMGANAIDFAYAIHSGVGEKICGAKADGKIISLDEPLKNTQIIEVMTNPQCHPTEAQYKIAKTSKARQKIHSWLTLNNVDFFDERKEPKVEEKHVHHRPKGNLKEGESHIPHVDGIRIGNSSNFVFSFAKCCTPKYPEPIVAYLSRLKGMVVHRKDCFVYQLIRNKEERSLDVEWDLPK
ncbi:MAG: bifunctional (p)ppGpp synthetase/guanosine-3',5'-bis(diphosphate) 3'-pyrophosphohydrolase [Treponema sp.]|nr:bifunctional (p)ppGpp synthetase/guanosine-3',5'-bis(diphosphate) 3'-pyrophosphohydrolase [Treponema sp.]